jgi:hypothetical protein
MRCAVLPGAHVTIRDSKTGIVTVFKINKNRSINKKSDQKPVCYSTISVFIKNQSIFKTEPHQFHQKP